MSNERLGIFEELRERAERYANQGEAIRKKIMGAGPADNGAYAQLANPFTRALRLKNGGKPYHSRGLDGRRRAIWPEAELGLNVLEVVQAVLLESGMSTGDLMGYSRHRKFSWPRHVAMWAIDRYCPDYSLPEIGYMFHRDHTTVMHAIDATNVRLIHGDAQTRDLVARVQKRLRAAGGD